MNTQTTFTMKQSGDARPGVMLVRVSKAKRSARLRSIATFLFRTGLGSTLGAYLSIFGMLVYSRNDNPPHNLDLLDVSLMLAFFMVPAFPLALVSRWLTLIFENLIEEKMTLLPHAIATGIFSILLLLAMWRTSEPFDSTAVKLLGAFGFTLGFPVGLLARLKLNLLDRLIYGGQEPVMDIRDLDRNLVLFVVGITGGLALRLVGIVGFMLAVLGLTVMWSDLELHERLVMVYAIYYFGCTAFVSLCIRSRWMVVGAAVFLNALLLALALFWEPSADVASPLRLAFTVLAILWILFMVGRPGKGVSTLPIKHSDS